MQLYAITDRRLFASREALIDQTALWATGGVDFVQIREKDLSNTDLAELAAAVVKAVGSTKRHTRVLLNGPAEMAAETGCDGVHLPGGLPDSAIADAEASMARVPAPIISISCHTIAEIERARDRGATLALFAPVFEKRLGKETHPGQGLRVLAEACQVAVQMPVFALGGITARNALDCIDAGAAGIAAIRLFASGDWHKLRLLR